MNRSVVGDIHGIQSSVDIQRGKNAIIKFLRKIIARATGASLRPFCERAEQTECTGAAGEAGERRGAREAQNKFIL